MGGKKVSNNVKHLTDEERAARREYYRQWRERNKDKIKAAQKRFYQKQVNKLAEEHAKDNPAE